MDYKNKMFENKSFKITMIVLHQGVNSLYNFETPETSPWILDKQGYFDKPVLIYKNQLNQEIQFFTQQHENPGKQLTYICKAGFYSQQGQIKEINTPLKFRFLLKKSFLAQNPKYCYLSLKGFQSNHPSFANKINGYNLQLGDVIKLGRLSFRVVQIKRKRHDSQIQIYEDLLEPEQESQKANELTCRICLDTQKQNLIKLNCQCKGSFSHVHFECLHIWVQQYMSSYKEKNCFQYLFQKGACDICKREFQRRVKVGEKWVDLFDIKRPQQDPYLVLERIDRGNDQKKSIFVFCGQEYTEIILGRSQNSDYYLTDNSISRQHASINFVQDSFFLKDLDSRYGTLLQLNKNMYFDAQNVDIKMGKIICRFSKMAQEQIN